MSEDKPPKNIEEKINEYKKDKVLSKYYNIHVYKCLITKKWIVTYLSKYYTAPV